MFEGLMVNGTRKSRGLGEFSVLEFVALLPAFMIRVGEDSPTLGVAFCVSFWRLQ